MDPNLRKKILSFFLAKLTFAIVRESQMKNNLKQPVISNQAGLDLSSATPENKEIMICN